MYKLYKTINGQDAAVKINEDGGMVSFLFDLSNTDYQAYLKFLEEGGVPEPAEVTE
jgi:hypothetical protein